MAKRKKKPRKQPADQAGASPLTGFVPPAEYRWQPGQSGNPEGRPRAGATIKEWINVFAEQNLTAAAVRKIARGAEEPLPRRMAAERMLRTVETGDIADFAGLLRGENNLEDLRGMGINTEVVKKFKQKTRVIEGKDGKKVEEVVDREIELHDRAGDDFDRIMDRTDGKPKQTIDLKQTSTDIMPDEQLVAMLLKMKSPASCWPPGVRARYEAGMVPGYSKKGK